MSATSGPSPLRCELGLQFGWQRVQIFFADLQTFADVNASAVAHLLRARHETRGLKVVRSRVAPLSRAPPKRRQITGAKLTPQQCAK
jgi:hypothetical protein